MGVIADFDAGTPLDFSGELREFAEHSLDERGFAAAVVNCFAKFLLAVLVF